MNVISILNYAACGESFSGRDLTYLRSLWLYVLYITMYTLQSRILDVIRTKVLRVFLLAIHSHIY